MWVSTEGTVSQFFCEFLGMVGMPAPVPSESMYAV
jgi:hypothetical protein